MSTGAKASNQAPTQSGIGTSVPMSSPKVESRKVVGPAGNGTSGTNQGSMRGPQGNK